MIGDDLRFFYSVDPTRILTEAGVVVHEGAASIAIENFRGGSQAIPFDGGWLMLIHEWELVHTSRLLNNSFAARLEDRIVAIVEG